MDGYMKSKTITAMALIAAFGIAACNGDTDPDMPPPETGAEQPAPQQQQQQQMDPEAMALMTEAQELQQRLAPVEQEAMQDEALSSQLEQIQDQIEAAMRDENPELFEQMEQLEAEFMAAQEAGDDQRAQEIGMEAQGIEAELQAVQQDVLERPDIRGPIDEFEEARRTKMIEIDSEAGEIMDRLEEIFAEMQEQQPR